MKNPPPRVCQTCPRVTPMKAFYICWNSDKIKYSNVYHKIKDENTCRIKTKLRRMEKVQ